MPDLNKSISTRKKKLRKVWASKEWKDKKKAFIGNKGCSWCGSMERRTVHHPFRNGYGEEMYLDFFLSKCVILCFRCHAALHAGKVLCKCGKHYRPFDADECFTCYSQKYPEVLEKVRADKEQRRLANNARNKKRYQEAKVWKAKNKSRKGERP